MNAQTTTVFIDSELVDLLFKTYRGMVECFIPDLADSFEDDHACNAHCDINMSDPNLRDAIYDTTIDRLWDEEVGKRKSKVDGEILRAAARKITTYFCGPSADEEKVEEIEQTFLVSDLYAKE